MAGRNVTMHLPVYDHVETHAFHNPSRTSNPLNPDRAVRSSDSMKSDTLSKKAIRVLVAEDHDDTREALKLLLELDGYDVVTARDGEEALAAAVDKQPDVVITDFDMPRMDGAGFSEALRALDHPVSRVPIVVLTALNWTLVQRAMNAGADIHIAKPVDFQVLTSTLENVIERIRTARSEEL